MPRLSAAEIYTQDDVRSPAVQLSQVFDFQSYFDSSLLQNALLAQQLGEGIVASTRVDDQVPGHAIGLHPSSQTPVAVQVYSGSRTDKSASVYVLKPGQVLWPTGGDRQHAFSGFSWGLPFGWLGGGLATLVVFKEPEAQVYWGTSTEVIFHRARYAIKQPADLTVAGSFNNAPYNWPFRFPWPHAARGSGQVQQQGQPVISIGEPTRVLLALRGASTLAAANNVRMIFQATNDVGLDSAGDVILTNPIFEDITWNQWTSLGTSGNMATQNPFQVLTGGIARLAADDGGMLFVDASGSEAFNGLFIDVVRYGRL